MKILVVGASGMIGSTVLKTLSEKSEYQVFGSIQNEDWGKFFNPPIRERIISGVDVTRMDDLVALFDRVLPDVTINCAGLTKHKQGTEDPIVAIPLNALMPHRLAHLCKLVGSRMIHVSTDCVFSGKKGNYREDDFCDALDLYGKSKILGEVDYPHAITLRTSTIGPELQSSYGLLNWFLSQGGSCKGYSQAIFSGLPTVVFARIIRDIVIPHVELSGLYHVAASPINKFDLLGLIAKSYQKDIEIIQDDSFKIDRSLNSEKFRRATGYDSPTWPQLIKLMHEYK
jgi:dTDP-4-dehydrorhamnose reductase